MWTLPPNATSLPLPVHIWLCLCPYANMHVSLCQYACVLMITCICVLILIHACVHMLLCMCPYVYMHLSLCCYVCVLMFICICPHANIVKSPENISAHNARPTLLWWLDIKICGPYLPTPPPFPSLCTYDCACVLMLICMCPYANMHVSLWSHVYVSLSWYMHVSICYYNIGRCLLSYKYSLISNMKHLIPSTR